MAQLNQTFLNNIDESKVNDLLTQTETNVEYFTSVSDNVVKAYTQDLDALMEALYEKVIKEEAPATITLERYYLELTNLLYFMGERLERLGIQDDVSKSAAKEVYNRAYLNNQIKDADKKNKTTVAENQAVAEECAKYENTVNTIYARAYKQVRYKIDAGYEMVNTLRKIITRRMNEESQSSFAPKTNFTRGE